MTPAGEAGSEVRAEKLGSGREVFSEQENVWLCLQVGQLSSTATAWDLYLLIFGFCSVRCDTYTNPLAIFFWGGWGNVPCTSHRGLWSDALISSLLWKGRMSLSINHFLCAQGGRHACGASPCSLCYTLNKSKVPVSILLRQSDFTKLNRAYLWSPEWRNVSTSVCVCVCVCVRAVHSTHAGLRDNYSGDHLFSGMRYNHKRSRVNIQPRRRKRKGAGREGKARDSGLEGN